MVSTPENMDSMKNKIPCRNMEIYFLRPGLVSYTLTLSGEPSFRSSVVTASSPDAHRAPGEPSQSIPKCTSSAHFPKRYVECLQQTPHPTTYPCLHPASHVSGNQGSCSLSPHPHYQCHILIYRVMCKQW